jgi:hypothetical protein
MLEGRGYTITVEVNEHYKQAVFTGKFSLHPHRGQEYSLQWEDNDIIMDAIPKLLKWTGLKPTITLDY